MIFALSTATALAAEPADAPVSMRENIFIIIDAFFQIA